MKTTRYSLPDAQGERETNAPYKYDTISAVLTKGGWRKQERDFYMQGVEHEHRIEWWNLGAQYVLVYVLTDDRGQHAYLNRPIGTPRQLAQHLDRVAHPRSSSKAAR